MKPSILIAGLLAGLSFVANAAPISFIHTGSGSGTLGDMTFSDAAFTITETSDTDMLESCGSGCYFINAGSTVLDLAGVGRFDFISGTRTFANNGFVGLSRAGAEGIDLYNVFSVPGYALQWSVGPVSGEVELLQWNESGGDAVLTSGGVLVFEHAHTQGSFQAVTSAVPEPFASAMFAAGLIALGGLHAGRGRSR